MQYQYEEVILGAFNKYGFKPRQSQILTINNILQQYLNNNKKYVILSAPTGSGKSIIGVIVAQALSKLDAQFIANDKAKRISTILMHNKVLQTQYLNNFRSFDNFLDLRGAANYHCDVVNDNAQSCILKGHLKKSKGATLPQCMRCEYRLSRAQMYQRDYIITNYSYFLSIALNNKQGFGKQLLTIFDECHMFNDIFCNHSQIKISSTLLQNFITVLNTYLIGEDVNVELIDNISKLILQLKNKRVNVKNYMQFLKKTNSLVLSLSDHYLNQASEQYDSGDTQLYVKYMKLFNRFNGMANKYSILFEYNYQHIVNIQDQSVTIQPIFVKQLFDLKMVGGKYVLLMSATSQQYFMSTTLSIDENQLAFIKSPPVFHPSTKKIVFANIMPYNYKNMNDKKNINDICKIVSQIIMNHKEDKGVVIASSFQLSQQISKFVINKLKGVRIFTQDRGTPLQDTLKQFKVYKNPSLLISPSLWQGISLDDNISRYQIIVKAPYPSLSDKRIQYILKNYSKIYTIQTIFKLIQGLGRSTRNENDYSITYCLDSNLHRLFSSKDNVWKDQFQTIGE